jgi:hypothetical protein
VPRKVFVAGEILTAADVNTFLGDQAVMVFDDAAARTTAIPSPIEGMVTYLKDLDRLEQFDGSAFVRAAPAQTGVLQVKQVAKTNTFTTASTSFVDITGLSVSITPTSATNKVLVHVALNYSAVLGTNQAQVVLLRGSTQIAIGDTAGSRTRTTLGNLGPAAADVGNGNLMFLDSPATTSATTYKLQIRCNVAGTSFVNRSSTDTDAATFTRTISTITVFEVTP